MLHAAGVTKHFGGILAVSEVDLDVPRQAIVGLIGPNGSGKTTLFNLISGLVPCDRGRIHFQGEEITGLPPHRIARRGLTRTFQIPATFQKMTVLENLLVAGHDDPWRVASRRAGAVLELLDLAGARDEPAETLSGGQHKLLELGRALMREPELVLLDEIAAGVNPILVAKILTHLKELRQGGKTFLLIEHDMEIIKDLCDEIVVMHDGRVIAHGPFERVSRDPQVIEAYLGG